MTLWQFLSAVMPMWMLMVFGNSLRHGRTPLIERIARVSTPTMPMALCRYTRRLTGIWCFYFLVVALTALLIEHSSVWISGLLWLSAVGLFIGEHWLRPKMFPGHVFPGLLQQIRDTRYALHRDS